MKLEREIEEIIHLYFTKDFFFGNKYGLKESILKLINLKTNGKNDWIDRSLFKHIKNLLKGFTVINDSRLIDLDRCLRIICTKHEGKYVRSFIFQVSIFNYFSCYTHDYQISGEDLLYEDLIFIDSGEIVLVDDVFKILETYYPKLIWLPKSTLMRPIPELSMPDMEITVSDVLFTVSNY